MFLFLNTAFAEIADALSLCLRLQREMKPTLFPADLSTGVAKQITQIYAEFDCQGFDYYATKQLICKRKN